MSQNLLVTCECLIIGWIYGGWTWLLFASISLVVFHMIPIFQVNNLSPSEWVHLFTQQTTANPAFQIFLHLCWMCSCQPVTRVLLLSKVRYRLIKRRNCLSTRYQQCCRFHQGHGRKQTACIFQTLLEIRYSSSVSGKSDLGVPVFLLPPQPSRPAEASESWYTWPLMPIKPLVAGLQRLLRHDQQPSDYAS